MAIGGIVLATGVAERVSGRPLTCLCGRIAFWTGHVHGAENSQQFADWYSLTHIVHGLLLYLIAAVTLRRLPTAWRLFAAVFVESVWELIENSPTVIDRYRAATIAFGYTGDSVLNSLGDIAFMALGFAIAWRAPRWAAIAVGVMLEIIALVAIRDDLTLNILMLAHPIAAVKAWQAG